jgi:hypothetical protein
MTCYGVTGNFEGNIMRLVVALALVVFLTSSARADYRLSWCNDYANSAIGQNQQQLALKCRYWGPAWSPRKDGHLGWCMGISDLQ